MNKYIGKVCPFCKCEFDREDEIVLCSACDMPHHKACWIENQGCTTFGCLGTIRNVDDRENTVTEKEIVYEEAPLQKREHVFCTRCGAQNMASFSFCSKCGNRLESTGQGQVPPVYPQVPPIYSQIPPVYSQVPPVYPQIRPVNVNTSAYAGYGQSAGIDSDMAGLIGTNAQYYIPKFQKMMNQNEKVSWNWAAFFFAPYWFIYRKMYGYGIAMLAGCFFPVLAAAPVFLLFLAAGYIAIGLCGNYIYMKELEKRARQAKAWGEPYHSHFIFKNGGTSALAALLAVAGFFILNAIFTYYYMMA